MMRIIHINDVAGVACLLAIGQAGDGHDSMVRRIRKYDDYCLVMYYRDVLPPCRMNGQCSPPRTKPGNVRAAGVCLHGSRYSFWLHSLLDSWRADIIHIHDIPRAARLFRRWSHKIVYHHHGSNSRKPFESREYERRASHIILSTPDLLERKYHTDATYVPNPIDTDLFAPRDIPDSNRGLVMMKPWQTEEETLRIISEMGWGDMEWDLYRLGKDGQRWPYRTMPDLLSKYSRYANVVVNEDGSVDTTVRNTITLQALSLGLDVYTADGVWSGLPERHRPENACRRVMEIYRAVLEEGSTQ